MVISWRQPGVAVRLMIGLAVLSLFTAIGGAVAVFSFNQFRHSFDRVASTQLDAMAAAARLEQESQALAGLAPSLFVKGLGTGTLLAFSTEVYEQQATLQQLIQRLSDYVGGTEGVHRINSITDDLFRNADELSTVIFSTAGTEGDLTAALGEAGRALDDASRVMGTDDDATTIAEQVRPDDAQTTGAWLGDAGVLSAQIMQALSADSLDQIEVIEARVGKTLGNMADHTSLATSRYGALPEIQDRFASTLHGDRGVFSLRKQLVRMGDEARGLLTENENLSRELNEAVEVLVTDIRRDVALQNTTLDQVLATRSRIMTTLGVLGLLGAIGIAAYFHFSVIQRLNRLRHSMLNEQTAESITDLSQGRDEISEMARSFVHFVAEINRRDESVRKAQERLKNAIESISDGFSLYDDNDELVLSNTRYRTLLYPGLEEFVRPGQTFDNIIRKATEQDLIADARGQSEAWIARRFEQHKNPKGTTVQQRKDGRWIEVKERKTDGGDTVAIYTDITERRNFEARLLEEKQRTEEANQRITKQNLMLEALSKKLSKYLSPQVYSSIFSGQQQVEIASKRKKLTVLFSDIAGFTETTDNLESEELTSLLNNYLTEMSRIALEYGGTIDKYIGDAILIFFGDPESRGVGQDAVACVTMAIAMQRRMHVLQAQWSDLGLERPFKLRIGINTGYCTVGNFGSEDRMDYTIIGNEVNLAQRLQARAEPGGILLSYETWSLTKDIALAEERDSVLVKGFSRPIRNYEVVGIYDDLAATGSIVHRERDGFGLQVDFGKVGPDNKAEIISDIEAVLARLRLSPA